MYSATIVLNQQLEKEFGEKLGATDDQHAACRVAFGEYMALVGLARFVLKRERNL